MKTFFQFISESQAVQQATRMGLKSDGHGGWYDNKGEFIAKTERGQLKFFNKRQKIQQQDPPQSDREKKLSGTAPATPAQANSPFKSVSSCSSVILAKFIFFNVSTILS